MKEAEGQSENRPRQTELMMGTWVACLEEIKALEKNGGRNYKVKVKEEDISRWINMFL